jgi:hypothetical protein
MDQPPPAKQRYVFFGLMGVLIIAFALRYVYWQRYTQRFTEPDWPTDYRGYIKAAHELHDHGWPDPETSPVFRSWPPLFPLYLEVGYQLFGENTHRLFCWLALFCSTAVVFLGYVLARRWGYGPASALLGAAALAVNPAMLFHAAFVLTDTPFTLLVTLSAILMLSYLKRPTLGRLTASALVPVLSTYLRFAGVVVVGTLGGLLLLRAARRPARGARDALIFLALSVVLLIPLRIMTGFPSFNLVHGGAVSNAKYTGNNPLAFWEVYSSDTGRMTDTIHMYQAVYYSGMFCLAVAGMFRRWSLKELGTFGMIVATFLLCTPWLVGTCPYFRYRMPIEPLILLFSLGGFEMLYRLLSRAHPVRRLPPAGPTPNG